MSALAHLPIIDLRSRLRRADWIIGRRVQTTSITWHWNGPAVPPAHQSGLGLIAQLAADTTWQMQPGWGGTKHGAPHLMYHYVVDLFGAISQTSDADEILWHCAHADGNAHGLAIHMPLGAGQTPSAAQLASLCNLTSALRQDYGIPLQRVLGHQEWKHATACPGPSLMRHLTIYRGGDVPLPAPTPTPAGLSVYRVRSDLSAPARVWQAPTTTALIVGRLKPGTRLFVDEVKTLGERVGGDRRWAHMARVSNEQTDLGFISMTLLEAV